MDIRINPPIHPGEMVREDFLVPLNMSAGQLAKALGVPRSRIERLVREETDLSVDTAMRLARYFKMSERFWLGIRAQFELDRARSDPDLVAQIDAIVPLPRPDLEGPIPFAEDSPGDEAA